MLTDKDIYEGMIVRCSMHPFKSLLGKITRIDYCTMCKCNHYRVTSFDPPYKSGIMDVKYLEKANTSRKESTRLVDKFYEHYQ